MKARLPGSRVRGFVVAVSEPSKAGHWEYQSGWIVADNGDRVEFSSGGARCEQQLYVRSRVEFEIIECRTGKQAAYLRVVGSVAHATEFASLKLSGLLRSRRIKPDIQKSTSSDRLAAPPVLAEYLLYLVLPAADREHIPGDLAEEYATLVLPKFGRSKADFWFWKQSIGSFFALLVGKVVRLVSLASVAELLRRLFRIS